MDATKNPCEDFFQYACGTWNKKHVIPEDRSSISTFEVSRRAWKIYEPLPSDAWMYAKGEKNFYLSEKKEPVELTHLIMSSETGETPSFISTRHKTFYSHIQCNKHIQWIQTTTREARKALFV